MQPATTCNMCASCWSSSYTVGHCMQHVCFMLEQWLCSLPLHATCVLHVGAVAIQSATTCNMCASCWSSGYTACHYMQHVCFMLEQWLYSLPLHATCVLHVGAVAMQPATACNMCASCWSSSYTVGHYMQHVCFMLEQWLYSLPLHATCVLHVGAVAIQPATACNMCASCWSTSYTACHYMQHVCFMLEQWLYSQPLHATCVLHVGAVAIQPATACNMCASCWSSGYTACHYMQHVCFMLEQWLYSLPLHATCVPLCYRS